MGHSRISIHLVTHHDELVFVFIIMSFLLLMVMVIVMIFINLYGCCRCLHHDFLEQPIVVVRLVIFGTPQRG